MKSTVEALEGNKVKVVVDIEEAEFDRDLDAAFQRLAREVRLPGFRPGKAPRKVLEARIGQEYARQEAFREALPNYYTEAVKEHEVDVIAPPEIDITNGTESGPVTFDAVVEIRPSITVSGYDALEIEIEAPEVANDDLDEAVDRFRGGFGELVTVERAGADGDQAVIDIETMHEGEPVPGFTTTGYSYKLGSGAIGIEAFDENLIGASAGDVVEFTADHPDEDEEEPLEFTVTVGEVQETVLPEATDEWVAQNSEFASVDELREDYRSNMTTAKINQAQAMRRNKIAEALAALVEDDEVPPAMIEMETENQAQDMAMRLRAQGMELDTFMQMTGQTQEDLVAQFRVQAENSARLDLALRAIADAEKLDVSDADIDEQLDELATQIQRDLDEVRADFVDAGRMPALRSDLLKEKAFDWVTERANLVDGDGQPVSPDALQLPTQDDEADAAAEDSSEAADVEPGEDDK
ncbi:MAG: trigger factor [Actinomycetota bacterium]